MDTFYRNYLKKNIPLPSEEEYKVQFISKVESLINRMKWKALWFLGKLKTQQKESYGFHSMVFLASPSPFRKIFSVPYLHLQTH